MRLTLNRGCVVTCAAVLALLAGCLQSVAQQEVRHQTSVARPGVTPHERVAVHPFLNAKAVKGTLSMIVVSDAADNVVNVYNNSGTLIGQLNGFFEPQGLASDRAGNLYVADTANSRIQIYAKGFTSPPTTLSDPGQYPAGVDVRGNGGLIAVTNIIDTNGGPGSVTLYRNGVAKATILNSSFARVYFCAFDATGNLYVDGEDASGNVLVGEIANASTGGRTFSTLTYSAPISFPGGIQVTNSGQIAILDQLGPIIYTFNPPVGGSLGSPVATTTLDGSSDPVTFAFKVAALQLYTADAGLAESLEFAYPGGGSSEATISVGGQPIGVAVVPTQMPW